jgi:hypothetical protein
MKSAKVITLLAVSVLLVAMNATAAHAKNIKWRDIIGIIEAGNIVGVGDQGFNGPPFNLGTLPQTGGIPGGAPWSTLGGSVEVNPDTGKIQFQVKGLVLAGGSFNKFGIVLAGLPIGSPDGVTDVIGTLVCNVDGTGDGSGTSTTVDTSPVSLSSKGDAQFNGKFGPLPDVCTSDPNPGNIAFLIRIFNPAGFRNVWIANGAVLDR